MGGATKEKLQNGCYKTFEEIFLTYFNSVNYFLYRILRSKNEAEKLAQEIFVKLWVDRESIDVNGSLNAYLYSLARDAAISYLKDKFAKEMIGSEYNKADLMQMKNPNDSLYAKEINLLIEMAVSEMPEYKRNSPVNMYEEYLPIETQQH